MTKHGDESATGDGPLKDSTYYTTTDSSALSLADPEKPPHSHSPSPPLSAIPDTTDNNITAHPPRNNNNATTTTTPGSTSLSEKDDPDVFDTPNPLTLHPSAATTIDFPEGGLTGWLVVLGSFSAMLSLFGLINSAAVFESYFSTHQLADKTASEIGWIFSLYLFIVFFVGIQVGPIFDRFGARILVAVGGGLIFLSLLLLSWCEGMLPMFSFLVEWMWVGGRDG
jgi:hypothetical protein